VPLPRKSLQYVQNIQQNIAKINVTVTVNESGVQVPIPTGAIPTGAIPTGIIPTPIILTPLRHSLDGNVTLTLTLIRQ